MNPTPSVTMEAPWPGLPEQRRPYEVVLSVPREDGGEPLVPYALPSEILACWSAEKVTASAVVSAASPSNAVAAVEALVPGLAQAAGAVVTASPAPVKATCSPAGPGIL
jgi:hypothetical protein